MDGPAETDMFKDVVGYLRYQHMFDEPEMSESKTLPPVKAQAQANVQMKELPPTPPPSEEQTEPEPPIACPEPIHVAHELATPAPVTIPAPVSDSPKPDPPAACTPRSPLIHRNHRPFDLSLTRSNGLSTISTPALRRCIVDARTESVATITQVSRPRPANFPKTPATPSPLIAMGNLPSSITNPGFPIDDNASGHSVVRNPARVLRKSSTNPLFARRVGHRTRRPSNFTAAVIQVQQDPSANSLTVIQDDDIDDSKAVDDLEVEVNEPEAAREEEQPLRSASTATITNGDTLRPCSATSTVRQSRVENHDPKLAEKSVYRHNKSESDLRQKNALHRQLAMSPSIPAPSPLPEDSPHKYGLKDRMDSIELAEPEKINVQPTRRRSSGLDIFHEAKSLQSASSFLNGLSTSRRRAESLACDTTDACHTTSKPHPKSNPNLRTTDAPRLRQKYPKPPKSKNPSTYTSERLRGHNFKPSGFAFSRPLNPSQIHCYRAHARLMRSGNSKTRAPVECAVCHIDDDQDHFSCSWCALRMCRFCRKDFAENGVAALKRRVRLAEMGGGSESEDGDGDEGVR